MNRWKKMLSRFLNVCIIFLAAVCLILFFKITTDSDVSIGGVRFYYVVTDSMYPTIKPYSLMVVKQTDPQTLQEGDIISFVSRDPAIFGMVNTHRIYEITEADNSLAFVTMGDNNPTPDSLLVYPDEIKGKVILHTPPIKALASVFLFAGTKAGFFIVILMPLMVVAAMFFGSFLKEMQASLQQEMKELEELRSSCLMTEQEGDSHPSQIVDGSSHPSETVDGISSPSETGVGISRQEAQMLLEAYFGKSLSEITQEDIRQKLEQLETTAREEQADGETE